MIFYFSGCGNSKHVAETIAAGLNDSLIYIPEAAREGRYEYTLAEGERLGFVFPIYSWAPPKLVLDFVKKMTVKVPEPVEGPTLKPYIYFACTCGDNCGLAKPWKKKAGHFQRVLACKCPKLISAWQASNSTQKRTPN